MWHKGVMSAGSQWAQPGCASHGSAIQTNSNAGVLRMQTHTNAKSGRQDTWKDELIFSQFYTKGLYGSEKCTNSAFYLNLSNVYCMILKNQKKKTPDSKYWTSANKKMMIMTEKINKVIVLLPWIKGLTSFILWQIVMFCPLLRLWWFLKDKSVTWVCGAPLRLHTFMGFFSVSIGTADRNL